MLQHILDSASKAARDFGESLISPLDARQGGLFSDSHATDHRSDVSNVEDSLMQPFSPSHVTPLRAGTGHADHALISDRAAVMQGRPIVTYGTMGHAGDASEHTTQHRERPTRPNAQIPGSTEGPRESLRPGTHIGHTNVTAGHASSRSTQAGVAAEPSVPPHPATHAGVAAEPPVPPHPATHTRVAAEPLVPPHHVRQVGVTAEPTAPSHPVADAIWSEMHALSASSRIEQGSSQPSFPQAESVANVAYNAFEGVFEFASSVAELFTPVRPHGEGAQTPVIQSNLPVDQNDHGRNDSSADEHLVQDPSADEDSVQEDSGNGRILSVYIGSELGSECSEQRTTRGQRRALMTPTPRSVRRNRRPPRSRIRRPRVAKAHTGSDDHVTLALKLMQEQNGRIDQMITQQSQASQRTQEDLVEILKQRDSASCNLSKGSGGGQATASPQATTFLGNAVPKVPKLIVEEKGSGGKGQRLSERLIGLSDIRQRFGDFISSTHSVPNASVDLAEQILADASKLFEKYLACADASEKYNIKVTSVSTPEILDATQTYLQRALPLVRDKVSREILQAVPQEDWSRCSAYQELVGIIFCLHRRYDVTYPSDGDCVVHHLSLGPFANGAPKDQQTLERWWLAVVRLNALRPDSSVLKIPKHTMAKGLKQAIEAICVCPKTPSDVRYLLTKQAAEANLNGWDVNADSLRSLFCSAYDFLGQIGGNVGQADQKKTDICRRFLENRCPNSAKTCKFRHEASGRTAQTVEAQQALSGNTNTRKGGDVGKRTNLCYQWVNSGSCARGDQCRWVHDKSSKAGDKNICKDFQNGNCKRRNCRYRHVSSADKPKSNNGPAKVDANLAQTVQTFNESIEKLTCMMSKAMPAGTPTTDITSQGATSSASMQAEMSQTPFWEGFR